MILSFFGYDARSELSASLAGLPAPSFEGNLSGSGHQRQAQDNREFSHIDSPLGNCRSRVATTAVRPILYHRTGDLLVSAVTVIHRAELELFATRDAK